jgi:targeting protein for Xklp2
LVVLGSDAMLESPPAEEDEKESPKSFEFVPSNAKSADVASSTPKIQRPPPVKAVTTVPTCPKLTVKTEAFTPKVQATNSSRGLAPLTGSRAHPSALKQSMSVKRSVIKCPRELLAGKAATAANEIAQENQAVKRQKLDDGRTRQILNVKTRTLPHKGRGGGLAGSTEMSLSAMRKHRDDSHSLKEVTHYISAAEMVKKFESGTRELAIPHNRSLSHVSTHVPFIINFKLCAFLQFY